VAGAAIAEDLLSLALSTFEPAAGKAAIARFEREGGAKAKLYVGIVQHNLAFGDPAMVEAAIATLKAYWEKSGDPLALAYLGSATTMRGSILSGKGDMMGAAAAVDEGFKMMDKAVSLAPKDPAIRFLRAENGLGVAESSPFKRYDVIKQDLDALKSAFSSLSTNDQARWWLLSGRLAQATGKLGEAIKAYEQAARLAPGTPIAAEARARLAKLEE
jgi:tetratricopeptide (TPR) repeat protein